MKSKQVWRHRCEFCKKASLQFPAMEKHERHCTGNPNRVCRMCVLIGEAQTPLPELIKFMAGPPCEKWDSNDTKISGLRKLVSGCPACMLVAIRFCPHPPLFDFKAELKRFWEEKRELDQEDCSYA